jgi:hypothetical protein
VKLDPWLSPFQDSLKSRYAKAQEWIKRINETEGGLDKFSKVGPHHPSSSVSFADYLRGRISLACA